MKNYTHILNEGFDSYFKKLNEAKNKNSIFDYYDHNPDFDDFKSIVGKTIITNKNIEYEELNNIDEDEEGQEYLKSLLDTGLKIQNKKLIIPKGFEAKITVVDEETDGWNPYMILETQNGDEIYYYLDFEYDENLKYFIITNNLKEEALNEAVPRDLMSKIQNTYRYRTGKMRRTTDPLDYASADMQEITAADVMRMKKNGEDLNDIYVLNDDGNLIELDRYGHPVESGSTGYTRANQSLKKTLENAVKIYKGNIDYFSRTQPDKYAERTSDSERRYANRQLGNERLDKWNKEKIADFRQGLEGPSKEIAAIKKEYDDGDISRKEMEARIADLKNNRRLSQYAVDTYNTIKQDRADARYYDSNKASRRNIDAYEKAKNNLEWAQYKLKDNEEKLVKAQAGEGRGSQRIVDLKRKIASLKRDLEYYEKELAEDPAQKELDELQSYITKATQEINNNQAVIDKLLRKH